jgi:hypothetical protein
MKNKQRQSALCEECGSTIELHDDELKSIRGGQNQAGSPIMSYHHIVAGKINSSNASYQPFYQSDFSSAHGTVATGSVHSSSTITGTGHKGGSYTVHSQQTSAQTTGATTGSATVSQSTHQSVSGNGTSVSSNGTTVRTTVTGTGAAGQVETNSTPGTISIQVSDSDGQVIMDYSVTQGQEVSMKDGDLNIQIDNPYNNVLMNGHPVMMNQNDLLTQ